MMKTVMPSVLTTLDRGFVPRTNPYGAAAAKPTTPPVAISRLGLTSLDTPSLKRVVSLDFNLMFESGDETAVGAGGDAGALETTPESGSDDSDGCLSRVSVYVRCVHSPYQPVPPRYIPVRPSRGKLRLRVTIADRHRIFGLS